MTDFSAAPVPSVPSADALAAVGQVADLVRQVLAVKVRVRPTGDSFNSVLQDPPGPGIQHVQGTLGDGALWVELEVARAPLGVRIEAGGLFGELGPPLRTGANRRAIRRAGTGVSMRSACGW